MSRFGAADRESGLTLTRLCLKMLVLIGRGIPDRLPSGERQKGIAKGLAPLLGCGEKPHGLDCGGYFREMNTRGGTTTPPLVFIVHCSRLTNKMIHEKMKKA